MNPKAARAEGPSPLDWIETAVWLVRSAPRGALLCYYTGSIIALLGLLFFWADMSQGAYAREHLVEASFTAATFYIWMKCWQAVYLSKLSSYLLMEPEESWTIRRVVNLVVIQATLQPIGLFLRLIAAQILLPYIWTYSIFMGVAILGDGSNPSIRAVASGAIREAGLWWRQTHLALLGLLGFAFFIWMNVTMISALLPYAFRMLLGIESPFTRGGWGMFNSTFFGATLVATYLCFDPLRKAVFLVRHFHGVSLKSGEDLRVGLKTLRRGTRAVMAALALAGLVLALPIAPARAAEPPAARVESAQLDDSLNRVLERREYAWRLPRDKGVKEENQGWLATFLDGVAKTIGSAFKKVGKVLEKIGEWIRGILNRDAPKPSDSSGPLNWGGVARGTLVVLAVVLIILVGILLWRSRRKRVEVAQAQAGVAVPDLNEEHVTADQLPEDGWLQLARDLTARGELRLALRALYLAGLAHLGHRELIRLARHKSNREYDHELRRRARGNADLLSAFAANLLSFEASWYGEHNVTTETLGGFTQNLERIRAC